MAKRKKAEEKQPEEQTAPEAGHNSALSDAEKRALFIKGLGDLEGMLGKKNEIVADIRNHRKRIISYGFEPFEIDFALKLRKDEDGDMMSRRNREAHIARFLNHPIGTQVDFFQEPDRTPSVDKAHQEGKVSGAAGESCKSPHSPGTDQDQAWLRGWHEGQADLASGFKKLEAESEQDAELEDA